MSEHNPHNIQQGSYRRGVMLGLTLAELLLLLLFLFLLVSASLIFHRDERLKSVDDERRAFRIALGDQLGNLAKMPLSQILTPEQLAAPLASIKDLTTQRDDLSAQLGAAASELAAQRKSQSPSERSASELRQENEALRKMLEKRDRDEAAVRKLLARASVVDPKSPPVDTLGGGLSGLEAAKRIDPQTSPRETVDQALLQYAKGKKGAPKPSDPRAQLAQCKAELNNSIARTSHAEAQCRPGRSGDYPPCVYRNDGRAAYVYQVSLTEQGAVVRPGDTGDFEQIPWVASLPKLPLGNPISAEQFIDLSSPYRVAGDKQSPACRFYIRVYDNMGSASREDFKRLYLSVQSNFYHHLER